MEHRACDVFAAVAVFAAVGVITIIWENGIFVKIFWVRCCYIE
jgi:hypothetical protein